jgi:hypothetical protein
VDGYIPVDIDNDNSVFVILLLPAPEKRDTGVFIPLKRTVENNGGTIS